MVGEMSVRGNVGRGSVSRGFVLGEVSVGDVPGRQTVLQPKIGSSLKCFFSYARQPINESSID